MGKKTDAYTRSIGKLADECRQWLSGVTGAAAGIREIADKMTREMQALRKDRELLRKIDANITDDGIRKELAHYRKDIDELRREREVLHTHRDKCMSRLHGLRSELAKKVHEFKAFVTKKKASRNPFKGKKSVPAAERFIADTEHLLTDIDAVVKGW